MNKKIVLVGGPADGKQIEIPGTTRSVVLSYFDPKPIGIKADLFDDVIGWDDYGPIFNRGYIKGARYNIEGNTAVYEPPSD